VKRLLIAVALLAGCGSNTAWQLSAGTPPAHGAAGSVQVTTSSGFATAVGAVVLVLGTYEAVHGGLPYTGDRRPPEMAPDRRVSEQDCTKPLDLSLGNIRCK
jgi:hypothetical protein